MSIKDSAGRERFDLAFKNMLLDVAREDFGDPVMGTTRFDVCLYSAAAALVGAITVDRGAQVCGQVGKPCWQPSGGSGYRYRDSEGAANGVRSMVAQGGPAGRGHFIVKAGNNSRKLEMTMPTGIAKRLEGSSRVTAQVVTSDGRCFTAQLSRVLHTDATRFRARGAAESTAPPTTIVGSTTTSTTRAPTTTRPPTTTTRATTTSTSTTTTRTPTTLPGGGQSQWTKGLGAGWADFGQAIARDGSGNILVTGTFMNSVNFGGGALTSNGSVDVFVAKYSAAGVHQWSRSFGGGGSSDSGNGIAVDGSGNVYVVGAFGSSANLGGGTLTSAGGEDVFLVKYSANGAHVWSRRMGSTGADVARALAIDGGGNVVVTGNFQGTVDFGGGPFTVAGGGAFIAKYSSTGAHVWSRAAGGSAMGRGIAVDGADNVIVVGKYGGNADFGGGALPGVYQIVVAKYSPTGAHQWSRGLGGSGNDIGEAVAVDRGGNIVIAGEMEGSGDFGTGTLTSAGGRDAVVVKLSASGAPVWTKRLGGVGHDDGRAIAVDATDNVVVSGNFAAQVNFGGSPLTDAGGGDIFVAKYAPSGGHLWSRRVGGWEPDSGRGVAVDAATGNVNLVGGFGYNLVSDSGLQTMYSAGQSDVLVTRLAP